jgi:protein involved in polysaccharide export with SLBB domain
MPMVDPPSKRTLETVTAQQLDGRHRPRRGRGFAVEHVSKTVALKATGLVLCIFAIAWLDACSTAARTEVSAQETASEIAGVSENAAVSGQHDQASSQRLEAIWKIRTEQGLSPDFAIGPGDVVDVSVPGMEELKNREARVSADNAIALPLVGTISVKGMGEQAIREELLKRLKEYMRDPQVDVFVKQYRSREVAVAGMVQKPGVYTLTSRSDTILDMIGRAGGVKENASTHIIFIPASSSGDATLASQQSLIVDESSTSGQVRGDKINSAGPVKPISAEAAVDRAASDTVRSTQSKKQAAPHDSLKPSYEASQPILIDISSIRRETHFDVPAWPGDVIIVPAAGEVMVRGWVKNPGAFNITPGMTVLGAITAAGGELFSSSAEILRTADNGGEIQMLVDLRKVQRGAEPDSAVQSGDVVIVNRSVAGAVPYLAYTLFEKFNTAAYIPIF